MKILWPFIVVVFTFSTNLLAETVVLKSGEKLEGKIVEQTAKYIKMDPGIGMVMTYYVDDIDTIDGQKLQPAVKPVQPPEVQPQAQPEVQSQDQPQPDTQTSIPNVPAEVQTPVQVQAPIQVQVPVMVTHYSQPRYSSSNRSNKSVFHAIIILVIGILGFLGGFKSLRKKRLIENIPTSTVRGLALGLVELNGKAKKTKTILAPLTGTECTFYRYTIDRLEGSGKSRRWVTISKGDSVFCPFSVDDNTGQIMVLPRGAEFVMPTDYSFQTSMGSGLPDNLVSFMKNNGLAYKGLFGNYTLRFLEWHIKPEESVFVVGTAQKNTTQLEQHAQEVSNRLEELMKSVEQQPIAQDSNVQESGIPLEGWNRAATNAEHELLHEHSQINLQDEATDVIIAKGDGSEIFVISDQSRKDVLNKFSWQSFAYIWGGGAVTIIGVVYLLYCLGLWSGI